jgi:two-component system, NtrC family, sensor kinase
MSFAQLDAVRSHMSSLHETARPAPAGSPSVWSGTVPVALATTLLLLGLVNIGQRAANTDVEDGVLWVQRSTGVVAAEVDPRSAAGRAGVRSGDVLLAIDGHTVEGREDVYALQQAAQPGARHTYTLLTLEARRLAQVTLAPIPRGVGGLYYVLAAVGVLSLLVGTAVRSRRPTDQATLHFFWLSVAFYGVFTFSFSGRLDRVDWVIYWADQIATLLLPPLFLHFALVFPERSKIPVLAALANRHWPWLYVPATVLGLTRAVSLARASGDPAGLIDTIARLDRFEPLYVAVYLAVGLGIFGLALARVRSTTALRQLRWIVWGAAIGCGPFLLAYAVPFAFGATPSLAMELTAIPLGLIPLAFASAIVRYRLMDVEVILKRLLVYTAALSAIAAFYLMLLRATGSYLVPSEDDHRWVIAALATVVVLLLARPVKDVVQNGIDRMFYRGRYDYRRALVGFARELNADLDLDRLAERLLTRLQHTFGVDRLCLMSGTGLGDFEAVRHDGFDAPPPSITRRSSLATRLVQGHAVRLDDAMAAARYPAEEIEDWRDAGLFYFVPCVAKGTTIAVLALGRRDTGEPMTTEDVALLTTVAAQVATAIENARLYRELHLKAAEFDRLRVFNEHILESLDDGLLVVGSDGGIVRWNHAMERIHGIRRGEAVGRPLEVLFDADVVSAIQAARTATPNGGTELRVPLRPRRVAGDGRDRLLVDITTVPLLPMPGREWAGTIVMFEDVTTRARLEEQLRVSERMAALGLLAAGVAHEVNTPLTGISSYTQMLLEQADPADPRTAVLEKIEKQTFRAARIVNGLLNLSRPSGADDGERSLVDLNVVAADVLALLEHQFDKGSVRVRRELAATPVTVVGFEFKLQQVLLNLFLNARDAMPSGGWLTVATRIDGDRAMVDIGDTGAGVSPEHLDRIYDPFFTTKAIGQGTGLGLSISYGIVQEHGGSMQCESAVGQGTRFVLAFPRAASTTQPEQTRRHGLQ